VRWLLLGAIAQPGAKIEIAGILNQGEPARVDYIEFVPVSVAPLAGAGRKIIL